MTEEYTEEQLYALEEFLNAEDVHTTYNINNRVPVLGSGVELKKLSSNFYEAKWSVWRLGLDDSKHELLNCPCHIYEEGYVIRIPKKILDNIENIVKEDERTQLDYEIDYREETLENAYELGDPNIPDYIIEQCFDHYDALEIGLKLLYDLDEFFDEDGNYIEDGSDMTKIKEAFPDYPKVIHDFLLECLECAKKSEAH